ncbi:MAG: Xaa-Pro peptidase family protein [Nitrospirae bacterium]|nr:Xaa-Pro peptidase family protein [Nitrospirota bacterium]
MLQTPSLTESYMQGIKANYRDRIADIRKGVAKKKMDAFLVTNIKNIRYLTGFTGSSGFMLIEGGRSFFYTDSRYAEQAGQEAKGVEIGIERGRRIDVLRRLIKKLGVKRLGFETSISYEFYELLRNISVNPMPQKRVVEKMRSIKEDSELESIKKAVGRAEKAFLSMKRAIRIGATERGISLRLEEEIKKTGSRSIPFDIIVASGNNSAMPHARPTEKRIEKGDFVIIDWGAEADGYYSDMTRTLLINGGSISKKIRIYNIVNDARTKAIKTVRNGIKAKEIDAAARKLIIDKGYGNYFGHGVGHGVGLDIHEDPNVSPLSSSRISEGMVFTIEPGIYIPKLGGVRIEDMVAVRGGRADTLTTLSRHLEII